MTIKGHVGAHFDHLDPSNPLMPLLILLPLHNVDASTSGVTWSKTFPSHFNHLLASNDTDANTNVLTWPKIHFASHFSCLNLWDAAVPLVMFMAPCDTDASVSSIKLPKHHVAPHFNFLDLRSAMLPLSTLSASHDAWSGPNGDTWPIKSCCTFWSSWSRECNGTINDAVHITWCWHQCSGITLHKQQCQWHYVMPMLMSVASHDKEKLSSCTSFQLPWPKECNSDIDDAVGMMWNWCQCQWHQMTKRSCCASFTKECNGPIFLHLWHHVMPATVPDSPSSLVGGHPLIMYVLSICSSVSSFRAALMTSIDVYIGMSTIVLIVFMLIFTPVISLVLICAWLWQDSQRVIYNLGQGLCKMHTLYWWIHNMMHYNDWNSVATSLLIITTNGLWYVIIYTSVAEQ